MILKVTANVLNVRSAPNANSRIVGQVVKGLEVEAVDTGLWRYVRLESGTEGWAHGSFLTEAKGDASVLGWRVAKSLDVLLGEINAVAPKRSKAYDGSIGDTAHAARKSDHNPNANGIVLARDFTHDPAHGADMSVITERLRKSRDPRISYVIHNGFIFSATKQPFVWRKYTGADPHRHHAHVSVVSDPALYDDGQRWLT